jgi:hypothetical protein
MGKAPAEKCGIKIEGENKWMELLKKSTGHSRKDGHPREA